MTPSLLQKIEAFKGLDYQCSQNATTDAALSVVEECVALIDSRCSVCGDQLSNHATQESLCRSLTRQKEQFLDEDELPFEFLDRGDVFNTPSARYVKLEDDVAMVIWSGVIEPGVVKQFRPTTMVVPVWRQGLRRETFEAWYESIGSGMRPEHGEETEEHVRRVCRAAIEFVNQGTE